jgi:hypothetical protein
MQDITENLLKEITITERFFGGRLADTNPCPWDINCGYCEVWAENAQKKFGGESLWLDTISDELLVEEMEGMKGTINHCVLYRNGLYYDAQDFDGVIRRSNSTE